MSVAKFDEYLSKSEFCESFPGGAISERTADRWHTLRIGPPRIKLNKRVVYRRADVDRWIEEQASGQAAKAVKR